MLFFNFFDKKSVEMWVLRLKIILKKLKQLLFRLSSTKFQMCTLTSFSLKFFSIPNSKSYGNANFL